MFFVEHTKGGRAEVTVGKWAELLQAAVSWELWSTWWFENQWSYIWWPCCTRQRFCAWAHLTCGMHACLYASQQADVDVMSKAWAADATAMLPTSLLSCDAVNFIQHISLCHALFPENSHVSAMLTGWQQPCSCYDLASTVIIPCSAPAYAPVVPSIATSSMQYA